MVPDAVQKHRFDLEWLSAIQRAECPSLQPQLLAWDKIWGASRGALLTEMNQAFALTFLKWWCRSRMRSPAGSRSRIPSRDTAHEDQNVTALVWRSSALPWRAACRCRTSKCSTPPLPRSADRAAQDGPPRNVQVMNIGGQRWRSRDGGAIQGGVNADHAKQFAAILAKQPALSEKIMTDVESSLRRRIRGDRRPGPGAEVAPTARATTTRRSR